MNPTRLLAPLAFALTLLALSPARAQLDTDHWLPALWAAENLSGSTGSHWLTLTTPSTADVSVTVKDGNNNTVWTGTVSKSVPRQITLGTNPGTNYTPTSGLLGHLVFGTAALNAKHRHGLIVEASAPIFANIRHLATSQGDSLTSKGKKALGLEFRPAVMFNVRSAFSYRGVFFSVMATQPGTTTVTIDEIKNGVVLTGTTPVGGKTPDIVVTLQQYETYIVGIRDSANDGTNNVNNINGTRVRADKPVAVSSGSWLGGEGAATGQDIGIDQIAPVNLAGTQYVFMKGNASNGDPKERAILVATEPNTAIFVNGSATPTTTLVNAGDYASLTGLYTNGQNALVTTSKPVMAYQVIGGSNSTATPGFNFIPPLGADAVTTVDNIYNVQQLGTATLAVVARTGAPVTVNGVDIGVAATAVPGTTEWVTYRKANQTGTLTVSSTDTIAVAIFNVNNDVGAAGYFSGFPPTLIDLDFDGIPDGSDNCPEVGNSLQTDTDGDEVGDACDGCPNDINKTSPGICGCGQVDSALDANSNGTPDCQETDFCPDDEDKQFPGTCGCGVPDTNTDGDALADCLDGCDLDPNKLDPGQCGCGNVDLDGDFDGTADCLDQCPSDNKKNAPGVCGCGVADTDTDGDTIADCVDNCVNVPNSNQANCNAGQLDDNGGDACDDMGECCADGLVNLDESDIDCGGSCAPCDQYGDACNVGSDCASGFCVANLCGCASSADCPGAELTCTPDVCGADHLCASTAPVCELPIYYGVVTGPNGVLGSVKCWQTSPDSAPLCEMEGGTLKVGPPMCGP